VIGALAFLQRFGERRVGHQRAGDPEALVEAHQVRRGIDVDAAAARLQHRAHEGDGGALAVGAGDVDHRRHALLGVAERIEQPPHAVERKVDPLGMQRQQTRDDVVIAGHRLDCSARMAAKSRLRRNGVDIRRRWHSRVRRRRRRFG
jgi:hypothetical protein